jgi:hypothetical protein
MSEAGQTPVVVQSPVPNAGRWFRFDGTFSFGNLLIVAGLLGSSGYSYIRNDFVLQGALKEIGRLQGMISEQSERTTRLFAEQAQANRESLKENSERFQGIILGLQANMADAIRRAEERVGKLEGYLESRRRETDQRFEALNNQSLQNKADIQALLRSSGISLPGSPGLRQR